MDIAKILLDAGADVNRPNRKGRTPFVYAAMSGNVKNLFFLSIKQRISQVNYVETVGNNSITQIFSTKSSTNFH